MIKSVCTRHSYCVRDSFFLFCNLGVITKLFEVNGVDTTIASLRFTPHGDAIAVGTTDADVQLWDLTTLKRVRTLRGHQVQFKLMTTHEI